MTRKFDKYAGLSAVRKNNFAKFTPDEWKVYFQKTSHQALRRTYGLLCDRRGPEWERVKSLFIEALIAKQSEVVLAHGKEVNERRN